VKRPPPSIIPLEEHCAFVTRGESLLLVEQKGPRWRGLWKFPPLAKPPEKTAMHTATYPFTNHRITLRVWAGKAPTTLPEGQKWFPLASLPAMPSAHRRAVDACLSAGETFL